MPARDGDIYRLYNPVSPHPIEVTVAVSPGALRRGLSGHPPLESGKGMLFIFSDIAEQSMWMPDMRFALDIIWLNEQLEIVHVTYGAPPCPAADASCPRYSSQRPIKYAIEMRTGDAAAFGLKPGVTLRLAYFSDS